MSDAVVDQIASLLAGEPAETEQQETDETPEGGGEDQAAAAEQAPANEPHADSVEVTDEPVAEKTLNALAEKAGVEVKDLYGVEVPLKDLVDEEGNPMTATLGQLKDAYAETQTIDAEREAVAEQRRTNERDLLTARSELEQVVRMLGTSVTPELISLARDQMRASAEREAAKVLEIIPEWSDPEVQGTERKEMQKVLQDAGFREAEISSIFDARTIMLVRRLMHAERRLAKLDDEVEAQRQQRVSRKKRGAAPKGGKANQAQRVAKAKSGSTEQKIGAIAALIS